MIINVTRSQFHQHFTRAFFFVRKQIEQHFSNYVSAMQFFVAKISAKNVGEIDTLKAAADKLG